MKAGDIVRAIVPHQKLQKDRGVGAADTNIALSKYWGKRNEELNLPMNSSLSVSLAGLGTVTSIERQDLPGDNVWLNGSLLDQKSEFVIRLGRFLDLFRLPGEHFEIKTKNSVPTAAGLASSASGYAALVLSLNDLYGWQLTQDKLSILARLGSGSACRSIMGGFALWHRGDQDDGMDSCAERLACDWPEFRIGVVRVSEEIKSVSSRAGMRRTVATSALYRAWPQFAEEQCAVMVSALNQRDFELLGRTAEQNALSMHATMLAAWPPLLYWQPATVKVLGTVWQLREAGVAVYATMDAGPNVKLLFLEDQTEMVRYNFTGVDVYSVS